MPLQKPVEPNTRAAFSSIILSMFACALPRTFALFLLLLWLPACDSNKDDKRKGGDKRAQTGGAGDPAEDQGSGEPASSAHFEKDIRKKGCEILTPKRVADTFGVPEGELKQQKIMGCAYSWRGEDQLVEARVLQLRAHKSVENAVRWFDNTTRSQTKEELAEQMQVIKGKVKDHKEVDTKQKKKTTNQLLDIASDMIPEGGVTYEDVAGLGDQARINTNDGTLWIRVANLTFNVAGFKGKPMQKPDYRPADMKDVKKIAAMSKKARQGWLKETIDQRRSDGTEVAKLVLAHLK